MFQYPESGRYKRLCSKHIRETCREFGPHPQFCWCISANKIHSFNPPLKNNRLLFYYENVTKYYFTALLRLDVGVNGFWDGRFERAYIYVRVFNPHAPLNLSSQISSTYRHHEREKRLKYDQRVREVEHATFVPFVLSCTCGIGPSANVFLKRLGALLAEKYKTEYSLVMGLLRCRLNFVLLRAAVMCLRGTRSLRRDHSTIDVTCTDLAVTEGNIASFLSLYIYIYFLLYY